MYGTLDIKGKELPADFFTYFDKEGNRKQSPNAFGHNREWLDRQREIAFMFMTDKQKKGFRDMKRNWTGKVNSSLGIETA